MLHLPIPLSFAAESQRVQKHRLGQMASKVGILPFLRMQILGINCVALNRIMGPIA